MTTSRNDVLLQSDVKSASLK